MRRVLFFLVIVMIIILYPLMNQRYLSMVAMQRVAHPSNNKSTQEMIQLVGEVWDINVERSTFIIHIEEGISKSKLLIKFKDHPEIVQLIKQATHRFQITIKKDAFQFINPKNRGTFDYDQYLFASGVTGIYELVDYKPLACEKGACLHAFRLDMRFWIDDQLTKRFSPDYSGLLKALLLGDKTAFENYDHYKTLGLAHIFAISGLHFGILYHALKKILCFFPPIIRSIIISMLLGIALILVGGAYSAQRAFFMVLYSEICLLTGRKTDIYMNLSTSLLIILLLSPVAILSTGLHLSYYAYVCVAILYKKCFKTPLKNRLLESTRFAITIQLLLLPGTLYYFGTINLYGFIANLVMVPIVGLLLPGAILVLFLAILPFDPITDFLSWIVEKAIWGMDAFSILLPVKNDYFLLFKKGDFMLLVIWAGMLGLMLIFWPLFSNRRRWIRTISVSGLMAAFIMTFTPPVGQQITFFDVGHGDMSLIESNGYTILIDTGDGRLNAAETLRGRGITHLDALVLSHAHKDHIGDTLRLIENITIESIFLNLSTYEQFEEIPDKYDALFKIVTHSVVIDTGDSQLTIMPFKFTAEKEDPNKTNPNDDALIVHYKFRNWDGAFLGDVSDVLIDDWLDVKPQSLALDFIKTPHHGSNTSISRRLYTEQSLLSAFTSCSHRYGMPHKNLATLLEEEGISHFTTYRWGEINLNFSQDEMKVKTYLP